MNLSTMSYKQLVEILVNFLHGRKYVIVLDDVWSIDLCSEQMLHFLIVWTESEFCLQLKNKM